MASDPWHRTADELDALVGSTIAGKYHIDRLIGRGGMGAVFQATNAAIGKRVALKFLNVQAARDAEAALRFQREAQAASLVESAHIVQIFDAGQSERGLPFLVMELLLGEDLRARLRRETRIEPESAVRITIQVLRALKRAHDAGIVHRDLKPDNVFLCRRDDDSAFVKIVDFGISKVQRRADLDTLTHEGAVLGTAFYMSPEQAQSFPDIDGRTDLYSVGAMLYEMLTGEPPFSRPTYEAVLIAICTRDAADVRTKAPEIPEKLARVVARALSRNRDERYASADEFLADLEAAQRASRALAAKTRTAAGVWVDSRPQPSAPERYRTLVFALVAALGGFTLAAYLATRSEPSREASLPLAADSPQEAPAVAPSATASVSASATAPLMSAAATLPPPAVSARKAAPASTRSQHATKRDRPVKPAAPQPARSAGVAGGLGLSTREP